MKNFLILTFSFLLLEGLNGCKQKGNNPETGPVSTYTNLDSVIKVTTDPNIVPPETNPPMAPTTVKFSETKFDFGKIKAGDVVTHTYKFKNTGSMPLKVRHVKPSCSCTTPDWTKEEVPPGGEGFVTAGFNTVGMEGLNLKSITVYLNTIEKTQMLSFSADVLKQ